MWIICLNPSQICAPLGVKTMLNLSLADPGIATQQTIIYTLASIKREKFTLSSDLQENFQ